jgi:hypothetical protein
MILHDRANATSSAINVRGAAKGLEKLDNFRAGLPCPLVKLRCEPTARQHVA